MRGTATIAIVLLCAAAALTGCEASTANRHHSPAIEPTFRGDAVADARPSLVFPSKKQRRAEARLAARLASDPAGAPTLPWYATRNDHLPAAWGGYRSPVFERVHTFTIDEQAIHGGHVFDHFSTRTYRSRSYEVVR